MTHSISISYQCQTGDIAMFTPVYYCYFVQFTRVSFMLNQL